MKNTILLNFPFVIIAVSIFALATQKTQAESLHYYYFKEKRPLSLDTERVAIFEAAIGQQALAKGRFEKFGIRDSDVKPWPIHGWSVADVPTRKRSHSGIHEFVSQMAVEAAADFVSPVFQGTDGGPVIVKPEIRLRFREGIDTATAHTIIAQSNAGIIISEKWGGRQGAYRLKSIARNGFDVLAIANALAERPEVKFAVPSVIFTGQNLLIPNDTGFNDCWGIHNTGQSGGTEDIDMDGSEAWDITTGDTSIVVVVIDNGVQQNHPDINQRTGTDTTSDGPGDGGPVNQFDNHGTAVAGCASAIINNSLGTVGIAPSCRCASARTFITINSQGNWTSNAAWTIASLQWAEAIGARATNNSNSYGFTDPDIADEYQHTRDNGILHFAAAGNDASSSISYPASLPTVNAVAAIDRNGNLASFSNHGPGLAFSAPGVSIYTTDRTGSDGYNGSDDYTWADGTSFASPYAAGVAALLLSEEPSLTPAEVEQRMSNACFDLGALSYDTTFGWGLVNANNIFSAAGENNDPFLLNPWVDPPSGTITTDFEYTVDYHDVDGDPPEGVWVWIDSVSYGMDFVPGSGTPASGRYNYVTELSAGIHNYSFSTTDVRGGYREIGPDTGPFVDVPPPGAFTIIGYTIDDSPSIEPQNNGDGIFQSGEKVKIRPQLYYDGPVIAINIFASLLYDGSDLVIPNGHVAEYPYINTGESAYPLGEDHFPIFTNQDFTGTENIDVQIVWEVEDDAYSQLIVGGLGLDIQQAAYISVLPREWDFGVSGTDEDVSKLVTIYNNGTDSMNITNITPSHGDTTWTGGSFPWTISAGGSKIIEVTIETSGLQGLIEPHEIVMISDARLADYTPLLSDRIIITGLVSDTPPAYKVPGTISDSTWPDVSGNLIVWQESGDIYGYDLAAGTEIAVCTDSNNQSSPKISGNIVAWDDMRSGTNSDVYGYDLDTDEEFPVSTESINEELLGVDGNIVAFVRWDFTWPSYTDEIPGRNLYYYNKSTDVTTQVTYYNASGTGSPLILASADGDFTDGFITWSGRRHQWIGGGNGWSSAGETLIMKFEVGVDSAPVLIDEKVVDSYNIMSDTPTTSNGKITWVRDHRSSHPYHEHVWMWNSGAYSQVTTEGTDHDDPVIGTDFIVYEKDSAPGLFYWDLIGNSEALVTNMGYVNYWRTDKHMVVWRGGISSADGIYYTSINQADISVGSSDIVFSDSDPYEGDTIDVNVAVHNLNPWDTTENITVQLYDGDPNDPNTQLGSDEIVSGGIIAQGSAIVEFNDIPVGIEGSHNIYACIDVPGGDNPANNKAYKSLAVSDTDTQGPVISNVTVQEYNGDSDGYIEDDEQVMISWEANDISGINSSWCTIDANDYLASGTYFAIIGPFEAGLYDVNVSATDGDISGETSVYNDELAVITCDFDDDNDVDFEDFAMLALLWQDADCNDPNWCDFRDLDYNGEVKWPDIRIFADNWLEGTMP